MNDLQVKCFLEVAKSLNFSNAARKMFISQSNISRQISMFEDELGFSLFTRTTKTVKLTAAGEIIAENLTKITDEWEKAVNEAGSVVSRELGKISIGCTIHNKANSYLSQMLADYRMTHKGIQIVKERNSHKKLIEGLKIGYYDAILIASHDVCRLVNVDSISLFNSPVGIAVHKNNAIAQKENISLKDFANSDFLRYAPTDLPLQEDFLYRCGVFFGFEPKIKAEYEDFEEFLFATESGEGVALICEEDEIRENKNLRFISIKEECPYKNLPMQLTRRKSNMNKDLDDLFRFAKIRVRQELKGVKMAMNN